MGYALMQRRFRILELRAERLLTEMKVGCHWVEICDNQMVPDPDQVKKKMEALDRTLHLMEELSENMAKDLVHEGDQ